MATTLLSMEAALPLMEATLLFMGDSLLSMDAIPPNIGATLTRTGGGQRVSGSGCDRARGPQSTLGTERKEYCGHQAGTEEAHIRLYLAGTEESVLRLWVCLYQADSANRPYAQGR
eukprot:3543787-Rhodomonas_salina.1